MKWRFVSREKVRKMYTALFWKLTRTTLECFLNCQTLTFDYPNFQFSDLIIHSMPGHDLNTNCVFVINVTQLFGMKTRFLEISSSAKQEKTFLKWYNSFLAWKIPFLRSGINFLPISRTSRSHYNVCKCFK